MNDELKIFELYLESAVAKEQPTMTQYANGTKVWRQHGKMHRDNGPAFEGVDGGKEWYWHGMLHRQDGPAVERADGHKAWYLYGIFYKTAEQWAEALLKQRNEPNDEAMVAAFLKQILKKDAENAL